MYLPVAGRKEKKETENEENENTYKKVKPVKATFHLTASLICIHQTKR